MILICDSLAGIKNQLCGQIKLGPPNEKHKVYAGGCRSPLQCKNNKCVSTAGMSVMQSKQRKQCYNLHKRSSNNFEKNSRKIVC